MTVSEPTHVSIHTYYTLSQHFTCFSTSCLYGNCLLQSQDVDTAHWSSGQDLGLSLPMTQPQSLPGNPRPTSRCCKSRLSKINHTAFALFLPASSPLPLPPVLSLTKFSYSPGANHNFLREGFSDLLSHSPVILFLSKPYLIQNDGFINRFNYLVFPSHCVQSSITLLAQYLPQTQ